MEKITDLDKILDDFEDCNKEMDDISELSTNLQKTQIENNIKEECPKVVTENNITPSSSFEETNNNRLELNIESENFRQISQEDKLNNPFLKLGRQLPQWIPDTTSRICLSCHVSFDLPFSRHHCRACGKLLCSSCSKWRALLRFEDNVPRRGRVCATCFVHLIRIEAAENHGKEVDYTIFFPKKGVLKINKETQLEDNNTEKPPKSVAFSDGVRPGVDQSDESSNELSFLNDSFLFLTDFSEKFADHFNRYIKDKDIENEYDASTSDKLNHIEPMKIDVVANVIVTIEIDSIQTHELIRTISWRIQSNGMWVVGYPEITVLVELSSRQDTAVEPKWWCSDKDFHSNHCNQHCSCVSNACDLWLFAEILKLYYQYYIDASHDSSFVIPNHPSQFKLLESENINSPTSLGLMLCPIASSRSLIGLLLFGESEISHARMLPLRGVFGLSYISNIYPHPIINIQSEQDKNNSRPLFTGKADSILDCVDHASQYYYNEFIAFVELVCSVGLSAPQVSVTIMKIREPADEPIDNFGIPISKIPKVIFIAGSFEVPDPKSVQSFTSQSAQLVCVEHKTISNSKPTLITRAIYTQPDTMEKEEDYEINGTSDLTNKDKSITSNNISKENDESCTKRTSEEGNIVDSQIAEEKIHSGSTSNLNGKLIDQEKSFNNNFCEYNVSRITASGVLIIPQSQSKKDTTIEPQISIVEDVIVISVTQKQYKALIKSLDDQSDLMIHFGDSSTVRILWEADSFILCKQMPSFVTNDESIYDSFVKSNSEFPRNYMRRFFSYRIPCGQQLLPITTKHNNDIHLLWTSYHVMLRSVHHDDYFDNSPLMEFAQNIHIIFCETIDPYLKILGLEGIDKLGFSCKFGVKNDTYDDLCITWAVGCSAIDKDVNSDSVDLLPKKCEDQLRESSLFAKLMRFIIYVTNNRQESLASPIYEAIELQYKVIY